ncbi:aldehyde dehydrogenase [Multifurca ochricompacta]|uniref:Aldehyde dehydrogenase n=1 Tax=Multifurca ochricompacta TaxID=376703 RepID=A0AAD4M2M2_9AGAM|nr:aldehyde dehydrogenase [Multifurca ochricompacta]
MSNVPFTPLLINGEHRPASTGATFSVYSPHTGTLASTAAAATSDDCRAAIDAAQLAFPAWEETPYATRRQIFLRALETLQSEEWQKKATLPMRTEVAMPQPQVLFNLLAGTITLESIACMVNDLKGETLPSGIPGGQVFVQRRAQGVIYSVVPWNAPIPLLITSVVVPLVCGNTVVVRPSEFCPYTTSLVVDALHDAGLPAGVLNFVPMSVEDTPQLTSEIIGHPAVKRVTFTGSDRVGKIIAGEAAKHLKPCVLELGGKAPSVVLADADIDQASRAIVVGGLLYSGQICMSTERVIVQRPALEPLVAAIKQHINTLSVGDPQNAHLSSVFTERSADGIISMLKEAKEAGAEVVLGDFEKAGPALLKPHVLLGVKPEMRLWQRESFGPVLALAVVDTIDEAVQLANASDYSLAASLWTKDVYNAINVAMRIRSGSVSINGSTIHVESGHGLTGLGGSSGYGRFNVDNFTDKRVITLHPPKSNYGLLGL